MRVVVSFILSALLVSACQTLDNGRTGVLKPSAVGKEFKDLDAKDKNPFNRAATRVDYVITGVRTYDAFFKDAAELKGVVVLGDVVLKETDQYVTRVKKSGGKGVLDQKGQQEFIRRQERLAAITALLTETPARASALLETSQKLVTDAPKTFAGPQAFKLPGVTRGLEGAAADLKDAGKRAPGLAQHAVASTAALVGL